MGIFMKAADVSIRGHPQPFAAMGSPSDLYETVHTIAINTRETEIGSLVQPIPITFKTYRHFQTHGHPINAYYPQQMVTALAPLAPAARVPVIDNPSAGCLSPVKENEEKPREKETSSTVRPPPKKKWIKEYLEEEPQPSRPPSPPVRVVTVPVVRAPTPPAPPSILDYAEHSRPRAGSNSLGHQQVPSPPSVGSNGSGSGSSGSGGSAPRAGTREVHNKLEKNRRAHLKECFELLKRQLPATPDDKKTSNLSILGSAIRYIQVLRRKERECEHEMERLAREKIASQQRLATLKREVSVRVAAFTARNNDPEENNANEKINGQVLGIPLSISSSPPHARMESSPPRTLNLSTKLRTLPIQITPTASQVVRTSFGARHNAVTLTTLAPADNNTQNCQPGDNGVTGTLSSLVHPAQIHLPLSQVVSSNGLVVGGALQLVSTSNGLRVVQSPLHTNGVTVTTGENNRIPKENGLVSTLHATNGDHNGVLVNGLPLVVSQPTAHLLHTHTLAHKMVETQVVKTNTPIAVSAQYLSATTIVKPVVVVSSAPPT